MKTEDRWVAPIVMCDLRRMATSCGVRKVADRVLTDPRFSFWAGSSVEGAHHHYDGGLAEHTCEVAKLCFDTIDSLQIRDVNRQEMFLAALFHDVGKMWDYDKVDGKWVSTQHKRMIHHISRSGIEWMDASKGEYHEVIRDRVLHAILAHHCHREYGSPVAPKSRMAWLLTLCDQISARMNDCDTNDLIKPKE